MTGVAVRSRVRCRASRPAPGKQPPVPRTKDTGPPLQQPSHPCGPGTALSHDPRSRDPPSSPRKPPGNGPHASRRPLPSLARSHKAAPERGRTALPATRPTGTRPPRARHARRRAGRAICPATGARVRTRQRMRFRAADPWAPAQRKRGRRSSPLPVHAITKLRAPSPSSIRTVLPSGTSPPSSFSASGSCKYRCTARFNGRAP